ncbi:Maf/Ham1 protein [Obba rivulosa]|uniref:Maf/Ham1 protein n=1 Tax=Obba rivulosa TaxID=1052685 RepID=A0A8E2AWH5_9APHY|nr:Maf/Ham1 protein [Obba rivulosa]
MMSFLTGGSSASKAQIALPEYNCVLPHALRLPALEKLVGKRVVLASNSPRRKDILQTIGLAPEIVPSTFEETLSVHSFQDVHEYPVATATYKAVEVYERLVRENPDDAPDLVIGADTVVLTHASPGISSAPFMDGAGPQEVLEKPASAEDNLRMLLDINGGVCEVVTGVSVVFPVLEAPGYKIKSIDERTLVYFADSPRHVLEAYVASGEGLDRAGGFAVQGLGGLLVRKVDGDYQNVVGFPAASFYKFLEQLLEEETDFLDI